MGSAERINNGIEDEIILWNQLLIILTFTYNNAFRQTLVMQYFKEGCKFSIQRSSSHGICLKHNAF